MFIDQTATTQTLRENLLKNADRKINKKIKEVSLHFALATQKTIIIKKYYCFIGAKESFKLPKNSFIINQIPNSLI